MHAYLSVVTVGVRADGKAGGARAGFRVNRTHYKNLSSSNLIAETAEVRDTAEERS